MSRQLFHRTFPSLEPAFNLQVFKELIKLKRAAKFKQARRLLEPEQRSDHGVSEDAVKDLDDDSEDAVNGNGPSTSAPSRKCSRADATAKKCKTEGGEDNREDEQACKDSKALKAACKQAERQRRRAGREAHRAKLRGEAAAIQEKVEHLRKKLKVLEEHKNGDAEQLKQVSGGIAAGLLEFVVIASCL